MHGHAFLKCLCALIHRKSDIVLQLFNRLLSSIELNTKLTQPASILFSLLYISKATTYSLTFWYISKKCYMAQAHAHIAKEVRTLYGRSLVCFHRHPKQHSPLPRGLSNNATLSTSFTKHCDIQAMFCCFWKVDISKHWDCSNHQILIMIVAYCQNQVRCIRIPRYENIIIFKAESIGAIRSVEIFYKVNLSLIYPVWLIRLERNNSYLNLLKINYWN